jgi:uncharacterized FlaG/YvyC family protein
MKGDTILEEAQKDSGKLELIASRKFSTNDELVYVIDFLNKNLKSKNIMLGLSKDKQSEQMIIKIYEF